MKNPRIATLENLIARYEKSIADLAAIEEELRSLPSSATLEETRHLNRETRESIQRALIVARRRLEREILLERHPVGGVSAAVA